jgi:ABC-type sugar transport system permease subunit
MTTEHYNLQTGRAMTIADANGRASLFLGSVSTSLVALAFVGGIARSGTSLGQAFYVFALVLFPSLVFLGLVTFERVLQSGTEDIIYARGINRIRHLYQEEAPELQPYFILSAHDDNMGVLGNMAMRSGWWQTFLWAAGMIAVIITSVLTGALVGLLLAALVNLPLGAAVGVGVVAFLASVVLLQRYQWQQWGRSTAALSVRFPSGSDDEMRHFS